MSGQVYWSLELEIQPGKDAEFESLMAEMIAATRASEPDTLAYKWHRSADGRHCHIFERYADSAAVMVHLGHFQASFAERFFGVFRPERLTIYGSPSDAVREALAGLQPEFFDVVGGYAR